MTAREYLENKYPQMRGDKWNTHDVINDNWVAEMMTEYAEAKAKEAYNQGVRDAAENAEAIEGYNTGFSGSAASVDQQSILKLLK